MATTSQLAVRRVVPRWRSFKASLQTGELDPAELSKTRALGGEDAMKKKEDEWLSNRGLAFATDLVGAAQIFGITEVTKQAADFILSNASKTSSLAVRLAALALGLPETAQDTSTSALNSPQANTRSKIAELKKRRIAEPRNAFVWTDLSRLYVLLGLPLQAESALRVALTLAPFNRFILRCAARFFLHKGDPEEALHLLRGAERTKIDPWLLAAEVAVSQVADKRPRFLKFAEEVVNRGSLRPFHVSELLSALGSQKFWDSNTRAAKRLFASSLTEPTDNSLAQAVWAARDVGLLIPENAFRVPKAAEARALAAGNSSEWPSAFDYGKLWIQDEPFSSRPYGFASALGVSILDRAKEAETLAREGLQTNPDHPGLINNIAFALVEQGCPLEAKSELAKANIDLADDSARICLMATNGIIEYRLGNYVSGRKLYEEAIALAQELANFNLKGLARIYLAREEAFAGASGFGDLFERGAKEIAKNGTTQSIEIARVVQRQIETAIARPLLPKAMVLTNTVS